MPSHVNSFVKYCAVKSIFSESNLKVKRTGKLSMHRGPLLEPSIQIHDEC